MNRILTLLSLPLFACVVAGEDVDVDVQDTCEATIPEDATVANGAYTAASAGEVVWACSGQVTIQADDVTVYSEGGSQITVAGENATVYAKDGDTVTVSAETVTIYTETSSAVTAAGESVSVTECGEVIYDGGPAAGC